MILLGPSQLFLEAFINLKVMQLDYCGNFSINRTLYPSSFVLLKLILFAALLINL